MFLNWFSQDCIILYVAFLNRFFLYTISCKDSISVLTDFSYTEYFYKHLSRENIAIRIPPILINSVQSVPHASFNRIGSFFPTESRLLRTCLIHNLPLHKFPVHSSRLQIFPLHGFGYRMFRYIIFCYILFLTVLCHNSITVFSDR